MSHATAGGLDIETSSRAPDRHAVAQRNNRDSPIGIETCRATDWVSHLRGHGFSRACAARSLRGNRAAPPVASITSPRFAAAV